MAQESEVNEMNTFLERLITSRDNRDRELSLFIPFLLGFTALTDPDMTRPELGESRSDPDRVSVNNTNPDGSLGRSQRDRIIMVNPLTRGMVVTDPGMTRPELGETGSDPDRVSVNNTDPDGRLGQNQRDRIIIVNPLTRGMVIVIEGNGLDSLLRGVQGKDGQPPASKSSIEAMPSVAIGEGEEGECVICLDEWRVGENGVKEMPCKHRFHGGCIEKWLGLHGSCPVCRFTMPVEDDDSMEKDEDERDGEDDEEERRRREREIWVRFLFGNGRRRNDHLVNIGSDLGSGEPVSQNELSGSGLSEPVSQTELAGIGLGSSEMVNPTDLIGLGSGSGENDRGHSNNNNETEN